MSYKRGAAREYKVIDYLREAGYVAYRSAGSHGHADIVALHYGTPPMLIQVKADAHNAFAHFGPDDRWDLLQEARKVGATPVLIWWPPHGKMSVRIGPLWHAECGLPFTEQPVPG